MGFIILFLVIIVMAINNGRRERRITELEAQLLDLQNAIEQVQDHLWPEPEPALIAAREPLLEPKQRPSQVGTNVMTVALIIAVVIAALWFFAANPNLVR